MGKMPRIVPIFRKEPISNPGKSWIDAYQNHGNMYPNSTGDDATPVHMNLVPRGLKVMIPAGMVLFFPGSPASPVFLVPAAFMG